VIVAALADGAGSAQFAEHGAEIAVNEVIAAVSAVEIGATTLFADLVVRAAEKARAAVLAHADDQNADPRQFASTLLAIVSTDHGGGAIQIGDGVIVVNQDEGDWGWVFWPQRGEYAKGLS
jgi:serine/threonine protein phosphatase PrpC